MSENRKLLEMNVPMWFDGKSINEALFCEDFLRTRQIIFANGAFFTPDGRVTDDLPLRGEIYDKLKFCAVNNIPRKITNILEVLKLEAQVPDFPPNRIEFICPTVRYFWTAHLLRADLLLCGAVCLLPTIPTRPHLKSGRTFWMGCSMRRTSPPCRNISVTA